MKASPPRKGRGAVISPDGRFDAWQREAAADGWWNEEDEAPATELIVDTAKSVITYNDSPDIPYDRSINPYRGCEHGCAYCFARPSHAYLGLSPGLDFETKLAYKADAAQTLRRELAKPGYVCRPVALGINTDAWQPVERRLRVTRGILEVLAATRHPLTIVTKSALILRDLDLLAEMAHGDLVHAAVSITTLDGDLARAMEPRAPSPQRRLSVIAALAEARIPTAVMVAPLIPALSDHELENILAAAREAGATSAGYILLRLPHEVKPLFRAWLESHRPGRAEHVYSLMRQLHGGREYDSTFGTRQRGSGPLAEIIAQRFRIAVRRLGLDTLHVRLDVTAFRPPPLPPRATPQLSLF
ncbi:PA0069 family radical SAM protein [Sulfuritalea sp.]|uniref:PA0069 family radical SAM protein n=1 Tax=Sulfuritalea sp. TaxID=2480090 RepID=UPI00286EA15D|nr:PA0069 family radical SAM protein [Sulfuritalea sp.]